MKTLLRFGASVNKGNPCALQRTPLQEAIRSCPLLNAPTYKCQYVKHNQHLNINKEIEILDTLLQGGACLNIQDEEGNSPLHLCIRHATEDVADYLLNRGADPT